VSLIEKEKFTVDVNKCSSLKTIKARIFDGLSKAGLKTNHNITGILNINQLCEENYLIKIGMYFDSLENEIVVYWEREAI
jgi:hypothetical protein